MVCLNRHKYALLLGVICYTGCNKEAGSTTKPVPVVALKQSDHTVSGKVTYNGEPVKYGYVLMYHQLAVDAKTGTSAPPKAAAIDESGRYVLNNPLIGPCVICVATDPDADPSSLVRGSGSQGGPHPGLPGGKPGMPPMIPGPGGPSMPPGAPFPPTGPGAPGGPPVPPGPPGMRPGQPPYGPTRPPVPSRPPTMSQLTDEQKVTLREIHKQYGNRLASPLGFVVAGDADQVFDLVLTSKPTESDHSKPNPKR